MTFFSIMSFLAAVAFSSSILFVGKRVVGRKRKERELQLAQSSRVLLEGLPVRLVPMRRLDQSVEAFGVGEFLGVPGVRKPKRKVDELDASTRTKVFASGLLDSLLELI